MKYNYLNNHTENQKSYNDILYYIVSKTKTTRREIQKDTNYSWGTVSSVASLLIDKGLVKETDSFTNGVGRGTCYIIPNGKKYASIGVDINSIGFSVSVIGLDCEVLYFAMFPYESNTYDYTMNLLFRCIQIGIDFINNRYIVSSIGISCQGITENGEIYENFKFAQGWHNINLKKIIEDKFKIYTFIEHDIQCILESYLYAYAKEPSKIIICRIVSGCGFALYLGDKSTREIPLDFGNTVVSNNGNNIYTLEDICSTVGICKNANVDSYNEIVANREKYRPYLDNAAETLGITLANISRVFDIDQVVITGIVFDNDQKMLDKVSEIYEKYSFKRKTSRQVRFISSLSASFGAARLSMLAKIEKEKCI